MSDPLRARLTALLVEMRKPVDESVFGSALGLAMYQEVTSQWADKVEAALRAVPVGEDDVSLAAARVIQLETAIQGVLDAYGDDGWARSEMCRRLRAALNATPNVNAARAVAPEEP